MVCRSIPLKLSLPPAFAVLLPTGPAASLRVDSPAHICHYLYKYS
jgi:hypothetical protein